MTKAWIYIVGLASIGWGLVYALVPELLTDPTGYPDLGGSALTDVRGTMGGMQLGAGIFFTWLAARPALHRPALFGAAVLLASLGACRLVGLLADGWSTGQGALTVVEFSAALISAVLFRRTPD